MNRILFTATLVTGVLASAGSMAAAAIVAERGNMSPQTAYGDAPAASECPTMRPGPDWICVNGGWLPPGMPVPGGAAPPAAPAVPPPSTGCTTMRPGPDWVCVGGGWLPPGMARPAAASPAAPPPAAPRPAASPTACPTVRPGPDWVCVNGGWLPPGLAPPVPASSPAPTAAPAPASPASAPAALSPSTSTSAPAAPAGGRLRVMTWNLDHMRDPAGQAREIAASGADVVLLQEATRWHEDAPRTFPERLRQLTGHTWHSVWAPHFGRYSEQEGTLILTRLRVVDQSIRRVHDRGFSRVLVEVGGVHVNVLNAHLDWYDTSKRTAQLEDFMAWGRGFRGPRIAGGDFNAWWGEWWIRRMMEEHSDTWEDVTRSNQNGYTLNGAVRFDYLFRAFTDSWRLTPITISVPWTGRSDHYPVVADYTVR